MSRSMGLMAILTFLAACAASAPSVPAGHQPNEEAAVLEALDTYMTAISASDLEAVAKMQTPEGMTYRARVTEGGGMDIVAHPNSYWIDPSQNDGRALASRCAASADPVL